MKAITSVIFSGFMFFSLVLLSSALAAAQITVSGYATNWVRTGPYPTVSEPMLTTPSFALISAPPQVGANDATAGNVAGAADATVSIDPSGSNPVSPVSVVKVLSTSPRLPGGSNESAAQQNPQTFQFGVAVSEGSYGVAQLALGQWQAGSAKRVYTNADIVRLDEASGIIKDGENAQ